MFEFPALLKDSTLTILQFPGLLASRLAHKMFLMALFLAIAAMAWLFNFNKFHSFEVNKICTF